jgi:hypothetical protein
LFRLNPKGCDGQISLVSIMSQGQDKARRKPHFRWIARRIVFHHIPRKTYPTRGALVTSAKIEEAGLKVPGTEFRIYSDRKG